MEQIQCNWQYGSRTCWWKCGKLHKRIAWFKLSRSKKIVLAYDNAEGNNKVSINSFKKYFLPRVEIENYNIEIDGINFYDQPINDSIKQYDEIRKISTGHGDDYTAGCLLDFAYFEKNYRLIAADLSKQKALDADSRAIQQIIFTVK